RLAVRLGEPPHPTGHDGRLAQPLDQSPVDHGPDWRTFQLEYRDHIDLAKMAQMLPLVGAPVGAVVNWRLVERLGETAIMACRMRWFAEADR
ncbi:MAG: hypothetical protein EON85_13355, partial [Brevundimonas sp.]